MKLRNEMKSRIMKIIVKQNNKHKCFIQTIKKRKFVVRTFKIYECLEKEALGKFD